MSNNLKKNTRKRLQLFQCNQNLMVYFQLFFESRISNIKPIFGCFCCIFKLDIKYKFCSEYLSNGVESHGIIKCSRELQNEYSILLTNCLLSIANISKQEVFGGICL